MGQAGHRPSCLTSAPLAGSSTPRSLGLQRAEAAFDPLPFDAEAARAYGRIYAAVVAAGLKARGTRAVDLLVAAVACAGLPLYTRNADDFRAIGDLVEIVAV